jgi:hypothetical protein
MSKRNIRRAILAAGAAVLAALLHAQSGFRWDGPISRIITPNGDGLNDKAFFCFDNFADSDVTGTVYTLLGGQLANLQPRQNVAGQQCPAGSKEQFQTWDPQTQGQVSSGIYVYLVRAEGKTFSGTVVVVR